MKPGEVPAWRWRIEQQLQSSQWQHRIECVVETGDLYALTTMLNAYEQKVKDLTEYVLELEVELSRAYETLQNQTTGGNQ
ncbi:MAG: hypothetical protein DDT39_00031 [Firmicutes bacterium]|nr:hypothetical protein [candidate division NPL-UPA2 bacterium]